MPFISDLQHKADIRTELSKIKKGMADLDKEAFFEHQEVKGQRDFNITPITEEIGKLRDVVEGEPLKKINKELDKVIGEKEEVKVNPTEKPDDLDVFEEQEEPPPPYPMKRPMQGQEMLKDILDQYSHDGTDLLKDEDYLKNRPKYLRGLTQQQLSDSYNYYLAEKNAGKKTSISAAINRITKTKKSKKTKSASQKLLELSNQKKKKGSGLSPQDVEELVRYIAIYQGEINSGNTSQKARDILEQLYEIARSAGIM